MLPVARIETAVQSFANIVARNGVYNTTAESLDLLKQIRIVTDTGYTILLDRALINLKKGNLDSRQPVVVEMESGRIEAKAMRAEDGGNRVFFSGGVTSTFTNLFGPAGPVGGASPAEKTDAGQ